MTLCEMAACAAGCEGQRRTLRVPPPINDARMSSGVQLGYLCSQDEEIMQL